MMFKRFLDDFNDPLKHQIMKTKGYLSPEEHKEEFKTFCDLIEKCLHINPEKWIKPSEALKHEFFSKAKFMTEINKVDRQRKMSFTLVGGQQKEKMAVKLKPKLMDKWNRNFYKVSLWTH